MELPTTVLLLSNAQDEETDIIQNLLAQQQIPYFRLHTELIHLRYHLTIDLTTASFTIEDLQSGQRLESASVKVVWWSRVQTPDFSQRAVEPHLENFLSNEYFASVRALVTCLEFQGRKVISHPNTNVFAGEKVRQQLTAQQLGFLLPTQIITNSVAAFAKFYAQQPQCLFKPVFNSTYISQGTTSYFTYPTKISEDYYTWIMNDEVEFHVYHFQEQLEFHHEYRVVSFGNELYAFRIVGSYEMDWRKNLNELVFEYVPIVPFRQQCMAYRQKLNISLGCFDLIATPKGIYFIECNAPGFFLFCDTQNTVGLAEKFVAYLLAEE